MRPERGREAPILFLLDSAGVGGTELFTLRAIRALRDLGENVVLVLMRGEGPLLKDFQAAASEVVVLRAAGKPLALPRLALEFRDVVATRRPRAAFGQNASAGVLVGLAISRTDCSVRVISKRWERTRKPVLRAIWERAARSADVVLTNSPDTRRLESELEGRARQILYLPNIVEASMFETGMGSSIERAQKGPLRFVVAGRFSEDKGQDLAVEALALLSEDERSAMRIHFKGGGQFAANVAALAEARCVADCVVFSGPYQVPPNPFVEADVALIPSRTEGMPNTLIEALAIGRPVVTSEVGGVRAYANSHGVGSVVLSQPTPASLAMALREGMCNFAQLKRSADAQSANVRAAHSAAAVGRMLQQISNG